MVEQQLTGTPEEQAALETQKALLVQMKKDKAPKADIDVAVAELKRLKTVCGDVGPAPKQEKQAKKAKEAPVNANANQGPPKSEEEMAKLKADREEKKKQKEEAKANKKSKSERLNDQQKVVEKEVKQTGEDAYAANYGVPPMNRSQCNPEERFTKKYMNLSDLNAGLEGQTVRIRARAQNIRSQGKSCFIVMRETYDTVQTIVFEQNTSKGCKEFAGQITPESIVEITAKVVKPPQAIKDCSIQVELHVESIFNVGISVPVLPFQIADASRIVMNQSKEGYATDAQIVEETKEEKDEDQFACVKQDVRLNNRVIDLRVPTNQAIFRLQSGVCQLFREYFYSQGFVEIHSPKMLGGTSEGGSNVFRMTYMEGTQHEKPACLAQSPQLYKQMALCGDLKRVIEIGPVFRAEDSNTNRHLTEFTGLDMEMEFNVHYFEVLDMLGNMLAFLFNGLKTRYAKELSVINQQYPFEEFKVAEPCVKLSFREGVALLNAAGLKNEKGELIQQDPLDDLSTETERALGGLVREKYDTDFYMLYGYPEAARPFYTMLDPEDPRYTNSYDFFMRGEEITSGAQRIHDPELLAERATAKGIPPSTIASYIEAFKYGAPCHGGAGFGLERIVKFFCNLHNIRKASLFPRDPKRLTP